MEEKFYKDWGNVIREWRREMNMTQVDMAQFLGVHPQTYRMYEWGTRRISLWHWSRILDKWMHYE